MKTLKCDCPKCGRKEVVGKERISAAGTVGCAVLGGVVGSFIMPWVGTAAGAVIAGSIAGCDNHYDFLCPGCKHKWSEKL